MTNSWKARNKYEISSTRSGNKLANGHQGRREDLPTRMSLLGTGSRFPIVTLPHESRATSEVYAWLAAFGTRGRPLSQYGKLTDSRSEKREACKFMAGGQFLTKTLQSGRYNL